MREYEHLLLDHRDNGVLLITINRPDRLNAADAVLHHDLGAVWRDVGEDPEVRVAVITGAGRAFCAGGDMKADRGDQSPYDRVTTTLKEASAIVYSMIDCEKPIISAINGVAVGAGLAVALLADISIIGEEARLTDGHVRIGVAAGDHAAMLWPLLCGLAKAKYYLFTADFIDAREAERIGLVSKCVPQADLLSEAFSVADRLATGPQLAVRWTKKAINNWLRMAGPIFDTSLALEMINAFGPDSAEGGSAFRDRRPPTFDPATTDP
jgi:enoyl-CoA hydratase